LEQDIRLKRLLYRSWHRGCKETDIVLGNFAEENLGKLDALQLDMYEKLLDEQDWDIWNWLTGKDTPKDEYIPFLNMLRAYSLPKP
jgi:antitoxin CptB